MKRLALVLLAAGCSSITGETPDAAPPGCHASPDYGAATITGQHAEAQDGYLGLVGTLDDTVPDVFSLELYGDTFTTGTFEVGADYATCTVCAVIYADTDADGAVGSMYLATSGTVTLTEVSPRVTGSVAELAFVHVDLDDDLRSSPSPDGCASAMTSLTFDAPIAR